LIGKNGQKNTSTEYVSLFVAVYKMPTHFVDARQLAGFCFCASLALSGVLSTLYPQGNFLLIATRKTRYKYLTVQAGTPMTVKEMGPASPRGGPSSFDG
jgi:hypothetical protein